MSKNGKLRDSCLQILALKRSIKRQYVSNKLKMIGLTTQLEDK